MMKIIVLLTILLSQSLLAVIIEEKIAYTHDNQSLTGYLYYDANYQGKRPLILVVHEWWGLNNYAKDRAKQLAQLGYIGFAIDMYGTGQKTIHGKQAKTWMKAITQNKDKWQARANIALDVAKKHSQVNPNQTAAIGYCFGGATVMQMAYSGANLDAVISFHGSLIPPTDKQKINIKASILVNNGANDSFVKQTSIDQWQNAMKQSKTDWMFVNYANAKHSFTNPNADQYGKINGIKNLAYNKTADKRSWQLMQQFLDTIFNSL